MIEWVQKLMSHEQIQKKYERICSTYTERTADIKQYLCKTVIMDKEQLIEQSKTFNYTHTVDLQKKQILQNDNLIACFKYDRKSNYKRGMANVMGAFEDVKAFWEYYRVFWVLGSYVSEGLENRKESTELQDQITASLKYQAQFEEDMGNSFPTFTNMVKFSHDLLILSMVLQQIKKEDRAGPEVAKEILEKATPMIEKLKASAVATQVNFEQNKEVSQ